MKTYIHCIILSILVLSNGCMMGEQRYKAQREANEAAMRKAQAEAEIRNAPMVECNDKKASYQLLDCTWDSSGNGMNYIVAGKSFSHLEEALKYHQEFMDMHGQAISDCDNVRIEDKYSKIGIECDNSAMPPVFSYDGKSYRTLAAALAFYRNMYRNSIDIEMLGKYVELWDEAIQLQNAGKTVKAKRVHIAATEVLDKAIQDKKVYVIIPNCPLVFIYQDTSYNTISFNLGCISTSNYSSDDEYRSSITIQIMFNCKERSYYSKKDDEMCTDISIVEKIQEFASKQDDTGESFTGRIMFFRNNSSGNMLQAKLLSVSHLEK